MKPNIKEINVEFTKNLMKVALKSPKLELVVYISTENVTYRCVDPYTLSKKVAENIVRQFKNTLILRPSIIFGKGDNRYVMLYAKLIKIMPIIPVFSAQDCIIQPIHVNDVAQLVHRGIKKEVCGTYTITGSKPISFKELGIIIADILHKKTFFILIHKSIIEVCLLFSKFFLKRLFYMIKNTLILRNLTEKSIENVFGYKIRSIKKRLEESILL
jgi:NADH dehydrogenase